MTLVKRNYRTFDNLFEEILNNVPSSFGRQIGLNTPPVNIHESNEGFHLELLAPSLNKEDFKLNLEKGILTISYEQKSETEKNDYKTHLREFVTKSFKRSFSIENNINIDSIQAKYENGVLTIFLPKKEGAKILPKEISIQ